MAVAWGFSSGPTCNLQRQPPCCPLPPYPTLGIEAPANPFASPGRGFVLHVHLGDIGGPVLEPVVLQCDPGPHLHLQTTCLRTHCHWPPLLHPIPNRPMSNQFSRGRPRSMAIGWGRTLTRQAVESVCLVVWIPLHDISDVGGGKRVLGWFPAFAISLRPDGASPLRLLA